MGIEKNTGIKRTFLKDQFIRKTRKHTHTHTQVCVYLIEFQKNLKQKPTELKSKTDKPTIIGKFNIPLND